MLSLRRWIQYKSCSCASTADSMCSSTLRCSPVLPTSMLILMKSMEPKVLIPSRSVWIWIDVAAVSNTVNHAGALLSLWIKLSLAHWSCTVGQPIQANVCNTGDVTDSAGFTPSKQRMPVEKFVLLGPKKWSFFSYWTLYLWRMGRNTTHKHAKGDLNEKKNLCHFTFKDAWYTMHGEMVSSFTKYIGLWMRSVFSRKKEGGLFHYYMGLPRQILLYVNNILFNYFGF